MERKTSLVFLTLPALSQHPTKWRRQKVLTFVIFYFPSQCREGVKKMDAPGQNERCSPAWMLDG
jgi:hypothetical protein